MLSHYFGTHRRSAQIDIQQSDGVALVGQGMRQLRRNGRLAHATLPGQYQNDVLDIPETAFLERLGLGGGRGLGFGGIVSARLTGRLVGTTFAGRRLSGLVRSGAHTTGVGIFRWCYRWFRGATILGRRHGGEGDGNGGG